MTSPSAINIDVLLSTMNIVNIYNICFFSSITLKSMKNIIMLSNNEEL